MTSPAAVLDASAITAFLQAEPGAELVADVLPLAVVSSANWAEVVQKALATGRPIRDLRARFQALGTTIIPLEIGTAERAAAIQPLSHRKGLSLADRICLALAGEMHLPAYTADTAWSEVEIETVVKLIR